MGFRIPPNPFRHWPGPAVLIAASLLGGCGTFVVEDGGPAHGMDLSHVPDPIPRPEARSKYGNPDFYLVNGHRYEVLSNSKGYLARGIASWYGYKFHGRRTSNGETYNMYAMTAAHKTLPLPTYARVTNLRNHRSVIVRINDRGPFHENRLIDLSYAAASKLGIVKTGTGLVEVRAINTDHPQAANNAQASLSTEQKRGESAKTGPATGSADNGPDAELYLQVGAFISRSNAERLRTRLEGTGMPPVRIHEGRNGKSTVVYRVRVGPIPNAEKADELSARLANLGLGVSQVVID